MSAPRRRPEFWSVVTLAALATFALFLLYPLARLLISSMSGEDGGAAMLWRFCLHRPSIKALWIPGT